MNIYKKALSLFVCCSLVFSLYGESSSDKAEVGTSYLEQTSKAFSRVSKVATPAVVFIKTQFKRHKTSSPFGQESPFHFFHDEFFRRFFGEVPDHAPQHQPQTAGGSGFIVSKDGYILTNCHVVKDADSISVTLNDRQEYEAKVIGLDPKTDLAVIKIEADNLPIVKFGNSDELQIGEWVVAIGSPFSFEASLTVGVVSAKGRQDLGVATLEDFIQTDAAINPGNSGGPLLDLQGNVIGVNTAIYSNNGGYMGISFAIPSNLAKHIMNQIIDTGVVSRSYLGIVLQPIDQRMADALNLDKVEGALITEVVKDSPADKAGLKDGDIILSLNGRPVKSVNRFRNEIALMGIDSSIHIEVLRDQKVLDISTFLETLTETQVSSAETFHKMGFEIEDAKNLSPEVLSRNGINRDSKGVVITKIKPGSPAALAGLQPNFLITAIVEQRGHQKTIENAVDFGETIKKLADKKYIVFVVRHSNHFRYYPVKTQ